MSIGFDAILQRVLGRIPKKASQKAIWEQALEGKRTDLKGVIEARSESPMDTQTIQGIETYVDLQVESIMEGILAQDVWDKDSKTKIRNTGKLDVPAVYGLTDRSGTPISALNLTRLLNLTLNTYVQRLMGTEGRLVNRTGRFSNSVQINSLKFSSALAENRSVSVYFHYMVAPYSVFGQGGQMYSVKRDPSRLISQAIRNAFKETLSEESYSFLQGNITTRRRAL